MFTLAVALALCFYLSIVPLCLPHADVDDDADANVVADADVDDAVKTFDLL